MSQQVGYLAKEAYVSGCRLHRWSPLFQLQSSNNSIIATCDENEEIEFPGLTACATLLFPELMRAWPISIIRTVLDALSLRSRKDGANIQLQEEAMHGPIL